MTTYRFVGGLHDDPLGVDPMRQQLVQLRAQYGIPTFIAVEADAHFHAEVVGRRPEFRQMLDWTLRGAKTPDVAGELLDRCAGTLSFEPELALEVVQPASMIWLDSGRPGHSGSLMAFRLRMFKSAVEDPNAPADTPWSVNVADAAATLAVISQRRRHAALQGAGIIGQERDQRWFDALHAHVDPDADGWVAILCGFAHATQNGGDWTLRQRLIDDGHPTQAFYHVMQPPDQWIP